MRIRMFFLIAIAAVACILLTGSASAQAPVKLTVSVIGAGSDPVTTLTKSDFAVQDSGKPRAIDGFAGPGSYSAKPAQLEPNEFTNATSASQSGTVFVVLDTIHTRYLDERDIREMILKFLAKAAQAKRPVTLAVMNEKGLKVYHDYRTSSDVLLAALVRAGLGGMKSATPPAGVDDSAVSAEAARLTAFAKGDLSNPTPAEQPMRTSTDAPLLMFQEVAHAASGLPGRSALVWIANVVPFDINPKTMQFESPKESSHGVAVNGVAVGGLKDAISGDQLKRLAPIWRKSIHDVIFGGVAIYPVEARGVFSSGSSAFTINVMKTLAQLTGGKASYGTNDPFPEILQISHGNAGAYALSYASDATGNEFHRVEVTTKNSSLAISHPEGYFVTQAGGKEAPGADISMAMQSPLEYTGVIFKIVVGSIEEGAGGKKKVNFAVSLAGDSGVLNEAQRKVDIGMVASATNAKGDQVGKFSETAGGQFPPEAVQQIKELGFQLKRSMEISTGDCTVHFIIRDNQTGEMGSLLFPLKVQ